MSNRSPSIGPSRASSPVSPTTSNVRGPSGSSSNPPPGAYSPGMSLSPLLPSSGNTVPQPDELHALRFPSRSRSFNSLTIARDTSSSLGPSVPQFPLSKSAPRASNLSTIHTREASRVKSSAATDNIITAPVSSAVGAVSSTFQKPHFHESANCPGVKRGISIPKTLPQKSEYSCDSLFLPSKRTLKSTMGGATKRACLTNQNSKPSPVFPPNSSPSRNDVNTSPSKIAPTQSIVNANASECRPNGLSALVRLPLSSNPKPSDVDAASPSNRGKLTTNSEAVPINPKVGSSGASSPKVNNDVLQKGRCCPSAGTNPTRGKNNGRSRRTKNPGLNGRRWTEDEVQALLSCIMSPCRASSWAVVSERMNEKGLNRTAHGCHQHFHMLRACGRVLEGDGVSNMRHLTHNPRKKSTGKKKVTPPIGKSTFKPAQLDSRQSNVKTAIKKHSKGTHASPINGNINAGNLDRSPPSEGTLRKELSLSVGGEILDLVSDDSDPSVRNFSQGNDICAENGFSTCIAPKTATSICDFDSAQKDTHDVTLDALLATKKVDFSANGHFATPNDLGNEWHRGIGEKTNLPRLVRWTEKETEVLLRLISTHSNSRTWKDVSEYMTKAGFPKRSPLAYSVQYSRLRRKEGTTKPISSAPRHDNETKCLSFKGNATPNARKSQMSGRKSISAAVCNSSPDKVKCTESRESGTLKGKHVRVYRSSRRDSVDFRLNLNAEKPAKEGPELRENGFFHYCNLDSACPVEDSIPPFSGNVAKILKCIEFSVKNSSTPRLNCHASAEAECSTGCPKVVSRFAKVSGISLNIDPEFEVDQGGCSVTQQPKVRQKPQFLPQVSPRPMWTGKINTSTDFFESVDNSKYPEHQNDLLQSIELVDCTKSRCADAHSFESCERHDRVESVNRADIHHLQFGGTQTLECMDEASWMKKLSAAYGVENPTPTRALGNASKASKDCISVQQSPLVEVTVPNTFDPINELTGLLEDDRDNNLSTPSVGAAAMVEVDDEAGVNCLSLNANYTQFKSDLFGSSRDRHRPTLSILHGLTNERRRLDEIPQAALEHPNETKLYSNLIRSGPALSDIYIPAPCSAPKGNTSTTSKSDHPQSGKTSSLPELSSVSPAMSSKHPNDAGATTHLQGTVVDNDDIEFTFTRAVGLFSKKGSSQEVSEDGGQSSVFNEKTFDSNHFAENHRANAPIAALNTAITSIIDQLLEDVFCRASSTNSVKIYSRKRLQSSPNPNRASNVDVVCYTCEPVLANLHAETERLNTKSEIGENGISKTGLSDMHSQSEFKNIPLCGKVDPAALLETGPKSRASSFTIVKTTTAGPVLHPGGLKGGLALPASGNTVETNTRKQSSVTPKRVLGHTRTANSVQACLVLEKNSDSFESERLSSRILMDVNVGRSVEGKGNAKNGPTNCHSSGQILEPFQNKRNVKLPPTLNESTPSLLHTVPTPPTACRTSNKKNRSIHSSHETCSQKAELSGRCWKGEGCCLNDIHVFASSSNEVPSAVTAQSNDKPHSGDTKLSTQRDPLQHGTCVDANTHSDVTRSIPHATSLLRKTFHGNESSPNKKRIEERDASGTLNNKHPGKDITTKPACKEKKGKRGGRGKGFFKALGHGTCDAIYSSDDDIPLAQLPRNCTLKTSEQDNERDASFVLVALHSPSDRVKEKSRNTDSPRLRHQESAVINNVSAQENQGAALLDTKFSIPTLTAPVAQLIPASYGNHFGSVRRGYATPRRHVEQDVRDMTFRKDDDEEESTSGDVGGSTDSEYAFLQDPRFWGPLDGDGDSDISDVVDDGRPLGELFF